MSLPFRRRWDSVQTSGSALFDLAWRPVQLGDTLISAENRKGGRLLESADGVKWRTLKSNRVPGLMASNATHTRALGFGAPHGGVDLLSTIDARAWKEIASFNQRFRAAQPFEIVSIGRWWMLIGYQYRSGSMQLTTWWSADLQHWMSRAIGAPRNSRIRSVGPSIAATGDRVVLVDRNDGSVTIWRRPATAPELETVSGVLQSSGGPEGTGSIVRTVKAFRGTQLVGDVDVAADGSYALDLPPGRYELRTECQKKRITVRRKAITWTDTCQIK